MWCDVDIVDCHFGCCHHQTTQVGRVRGRHRPNRLSAVRYLGRVTDHVVDEVLGTGLLDYTGGPQFFSLIHDVQPRLPHARPMHELSGVERQANQLNIIHGPEPSILEPGSY